MKVVSTNIGNSRTVVWNKEEITTGIFKNPVDEPIYLGLEGVTDDSVIDRLNHGGIDKACYIFASDNYPDWQARHPYLEWSYGMFGENITIKGLDEKEMRIGDVYQLGDAKVQVSEPRQPCFKLNIRFNSKEAVKQFVSYQKSGCYLRILEPGMVENGDEMTLLKSNPKSLTVFETFKLIFSKNKSQELVQRALDDEFLAEATKEKFR
ncbi:MAG: MOSC domain-containing protein [Crocinitomicaceae bacterium]|nr:MOSC domain-containing protein [Crocinitomicaceae bacterium]